MRKKITIITIFVAIALCIGAPICRAEVINKIVAIVNDEVITQDELQESMLPFVADYKVRYDTEELEDKMDEARSDALNRLIEEKLLLEEAKKREMKVDDKDIEARVDRVKKRFASEEEFYQTIDESGMSIAKLKNKYRDQAMMRKLVNGLIDYNVQISPTQISAFYYGNKNLFTMPKMVRFKVLQLKPTDDRNLAQTKSLSEEILAKIKNGEDFEMLVKAYSQGPHIDKGGDMDYMPEDSIVSSIKEAISKLDIGGTSPIVKTSTGFNIIKLVDRQEAGTKTLEEVNDLIRERLFQREAELTLREFVDKLKEDAYIKIN